MSNFQQTEKTRISRDKAVNLPSIIENIKIETIDNEKQYNKKATFSVPNGASVEISYKRQVDTKGIFAKDVLPKGNCIFADICKTEVKKIEGKENYTISIDKNFIGEMSIKVGGKVYNISSDNKSENINIPNSSSATTNDKITTGEDLNKNEHEKKTPKAKIEEFVLSEESKKHYKLGVSISTPKDKSYSINYDGLVNGLPVCGTIPALAKNQDCHYENIVRLTKSDNNEGAIYLGIYKQFSGKITVISDGIKKEFKVPNLEKVEANKSTANSRESQENNLEAKLIGANKWQVTIPQNSNFQFIPSGGNQWLNFTTSKYTGSENNYFCLTRNNNNIIMEGCAGFKYKINNKEYTLGNFIEKNLSTQRIEPNEKINNKQGNHIDRLEPSEILKKYGGIDLKNMLNGVANTANIGVNREKSFGFPLYIASDLHYKNLEHIRNVASFIPKAIEELGGKYKEAIKDSRLCISNNNKRNGLKDNFYAGDYILLGSGEEKNSQEDLYQQIKQNLKNGLDDAIRRKETEVELSNLARELRIAKITLPYKQTGTANNKSNTPETVSDNIREAIKELKPGQRNFLANTEIVVGNYNTAIYREKTQELREPNFRMILLPYSSNSNAMAKNLANLLSGQLGISN